MGMYLGARVKEKFEDRMVWGYAPMELFENVDKEMFVCDVTEIQFTTVACKLCKRLDIKYFIEKDEMSIDFTTKDLFKIYKETDRILRTWSPKPFDENEEILSKHVKWLHDFVEVCLLNDDIKVSLA